LNFYFLILNKIILSIIALFCLTTICNAQVKVIKTTDGYTFIKNNEPYYVKGVGGHVQLDVAVNIGANSIRTWGVDDAEQILDAAHSKGLTVMLGFWLQHERHGFDYNNKDKVAKQTNYYKTIVDKFKNHPALLMWGIGNELNLNYTNPNCWDAVQELAYYIHQVDPNHPTSTVTAGLDSMVTQEIIKRVPDMDVYCINTYGDIANGTQNVEKFGWKGPFMITEWGPNGYWESDNTTWKVAIEQTSSEKKQVYFDRYNNYIQPAKKCIGSYAFLWGAKQEYTETWFGLFSKNNKITEPIDAIEMVFKNNNPTKPAPAIKSMLLNNKKAKDNINLLANQTYEAMVDAAIGVNMTTFIKDSANKFKYSWKILAESIDKKSGGDAEEEATEISGLIKKGNKSTIQITAPSQQGAYRLFVQIVYNDKVAYANIPFWVQSNPNAKQQNFVEFKKVNMASFDE
jgi:hypothetical protein